MGPLFIKKFAEFYSTIIDMRARRIERHAVLDHELKVGVEGIGGEILSGFKLLPDRRKIHRSLDVFRIVRQVEFHPIYPIL